MLAVKLSAVRWHSLICYCRFKLQTPIIEYGLAGHEALLSTAASTDALTVAGVVASPKELSRK